MCGESSPSIFPTMGSNVESAVAQVVQMYWPDDPDK